MKRDGGDLGSGLGTVENTHTQPVRIKENRKTTRVEPQEMQNTESANKVKGIQSLSSIRDTMAANLIFVCWKSVGRLPAWKLIHLRKNSCHS